jgi:hypothetical protein
LVLEDRHDFKDDDGVEDPWPRLLTDMVSVSVMSVADEASPSLLLSTLTLTNSFPCLLSRLRFDATCPSLASLASLESDCPRSIESGVTKGQWQNLDDDVGSSVGVEGRSPFSRQQQLSSATLCCNRVSLAIMRVLLLLSGAGRVLGLQLVLSCFPPQEGTSFAPRANAIIDVP